MIVLLAIRRALGRWSFFRRRFNHKTEPLARSSRSEPIAPRKPGTPDSTQSTQSFRSTASNRPKSHALSSNPPDIEARPPLPRTNSTARRELKNKISNPQFNGASNLVDDAPVKEKRKGRVWSMASIASLAAASDYYAPEDDDMAITPCSIPTILVDVEKESMRRSSLNLTQPCQRQSILIVGLKSEQRAKRGRSIKRVSWFDGQDGELDDVAEEEEKHTRFESPEANSRNTLCSLAEWEEVDESEVMDWEGMDFVRAAVMSNGKANGARRGSLPDYDTRRMSVFSESRRLSLVSEA